MSAIPQNWDKHLDELEEHYNPEKFFADQFTRPTNEPDVSAHFSLPALTEETELAEEALLSVDIQEDEKNIYVIAPLAGVSPENIDIEIENDILTIRGRRNNEYSEAGPNHILQECYWGKFSRSIVLPLPVISGTIKAELKQGVLKIILQKAQENIKTSIQIKEYD